MIPFVLCKKYTCPKVNECYRYLALSDDENQLYNCFQTICNKQDDYRLFMKIRPEDKIKELNNLNDELKVIEQGESNAK